MKQASEGHPSNISTFGYNKAHHMQPVQEFLPLLLEAFPNQVPAEYARYILGDEPVPTENNAAKKYVSEFYKKLRDIAASNPSKFLSLMKGQRFTNE